MRHELEHLHELECLSGPQLDRKLLFRDSETPISQIVSERRAAAFS
jgi:hypothetical protein